MSQTNQKKRVSMNIVDIENNFQKIRVAMNSQRDAILKQDSQIKTLQKQVDDLTKEVEHLSSKAPEEDAEVVSGDGAEYVEE